MSKVFDKGKVAVNQISLSIEKGTVFGFLGPNGAGKTTTVKLLTGMQEPTTGFCEVMGYNPAKDPVQVHQRSGVLTEHAQMYGHLTGTENLLFYAALFGVDDSKAKVRSEELLEALDLMDAKDQKLSSYSTGMRQRLSFARALIHSPEVLFLDEPTSGLDPESALHVNRMIQRLAKEEGTTVFLCTHQLRYAEEICDQFGLISDGSLMAVGDLATLRGMTREGTAYTLRSTLAPDTVSYQIESDGNYVVDVQNDEEIATIVRSLASRGASITHLSKKETSLEEIYFALVANQKEDA